jgi:hypothetical protein
MHAHELTGQKFGRWTVLSQSKNIDGQSAWYCQCDCGNKSVVRGCILVKGKSLSCGCINALCAYFHNRTHGMRKTKEYKSWDSIKQRCFNPKHKSYHQYGGRGIIICEEWRHSFEAFFAEIGPAPSKQHSVDRIDNSRGYEPGNIRWATASQQCRNKRGNTILTAFGETKLLCDWEVDKRLSVTRFSFQKRMEAGWPLECAILHPKRFGIRRGRGKDKSSNTPCGHRIVEAVA